MGTGARVLIVDDQPDNLDVLVSYLAEEGFELLVATDGEQALSLAKQHLPDIVLLDVMMPGLNGFEVCERLLIPQSEDAPTVIFMSALADADSTLKGFEVGGVDYVNKPLRREEVLARIRTHLTIRCQRQELQRKNTELQVLNNDLQAQIAQRLHAEQALDIADKRLTMLTAQEAKRWGIDAFVGQGHAVRHVLDEVRSLVTAPNTNVLVLGESGTGKELISRAIHFGSSRRNSPFVAVNCSSIPSELADAEFFGHVKGAYTGAIQDGAGYFVQADGGTLFLDEIGDMPLVLQAKLLRVLEDGMVTPVGGKKAKKVDVRVVAATNVDLHGQIQAKQFRQDLYYRLASYQIVLPPLRTRLEDIPLLVNHFLTLLAGQMGREKPVIQPAALRVLEAYSFPGNVRELKNMIEYALIASRGAEIAPQHLHFIGGEAAAFAATPPVVPIQHAPLETQDSSAMLQEYAADSACTDTAEELLLAYAQKQGRIDNTAAQAVLQVDHGRASYLLKKLHKEGRLIKQGQRRWTYYETP